MAKAFFDKNHKQLYKVWGDDNIDLHNLDVNSYIEKDISDSDFQDIRKGLKKPGLSGDSVIMEELVYDIGIKDADRFKKEIQDRVKAITDFLTNNENHPWHSSILEYKEALEAIDPSSITYPYTKSIEQYCEENSITYYHPLQIP